MDAAAKLATTVASLIHVCYTPKEAIRKVLDVIHKEWEDEYREICREKGKFFAQIFPNLLKKHWFRNCCLKPQEVKVLNRLMSGHCYDNKYLSLIRAITTDRCSVCFAIDDACHAIFNCRKHDSSRSNYEFFRKYDDLLSLLASKNEETFEELLSFIKKAKIDL